MEFGKKSHEASAEFHERSEWNLKMLSEMYSQISQYRIWFDDNWMEFWIFSSNLCEEQPESLTSNIAWTSGINSTAVLHSDWLTSNNHSIIHRIEKKSYSNELMGRLKENKEIYLCGDFNPINIGLLSGEIVHRIEKTLYSNELMERSKENKEIYLRL